MARGDPKLYILGDTKAARESVDELGNKLNSFDGEVKKASGAIATAFKSGLLAAGVAGGAALVKGFTDAISQEKSTDKAAASLGLSEKEAEELGDIAGSLYADAYGDSFGEVSDTIARVRSELGDLGKEDLEDVSGHALDFAEIFDLDIAESVTAAGLLMRNDLVEDGEEAFDILTAAAQRFPQGARDELLAATEEYSQFFGDLGVTGEEAFGLLADAAEEGGRFGVDKFGDAMKEFTSRATDMSTSTVEAYDTAGLNAEEMAGRILEGGDTARGALDDIIEGLQNIEDPTGRAKAAVALFGTPLEDLSVTEIPAFLDELENMGGGLGDVEGAADDASETFRGNTATSLEEFRRGAMQKLTAFIKEEVIPALKDFHEWWKENIQPTLEEAVDQFKEDVKPALEDLADTFREDLLPELKELWTAFEEDILPILLKFVEILLERVAPVVVEWGTTTARIVGGVVEGFRTLKNIISEVWTTVRDTFNKVTKFLTGVGTKIGMIAPGIWDAIASAFTSVINSVIDTWNDLNLEISIPDVPGVPGRGNTYDLVPDLPRIGGDPNTGKMGPPHITSAAAGGVFDRPTLAMIGDNPGPGPEIATPERLMRRIVREEMDTLSGREIVQNFYVRDDDAVPRRAAQELKAVELAVGAS